MRRLIALALLLLTACLAASPSRAEDTLAAVKQKGTLVVGVKNDYRPWGFIDPSGQVVGLEIDLAREVADKIGVKFYTFKSGKYKDILNPTREPTEDEKALVQGMVMEVYEKFVGIVAQERDMKVDDLKNGLADGRILSGKQAMEAGFVDGLGYFDDAIDKAEELASIKRARVVRYMEPFSLRNLFRFMGSNSSNNKAKIQIELTPNQLKLQTGRMYFLPAYMFN